VNRLLGTDLAAAEQRTILAQAGIETTDPETTVTVPLAREPQPLAVMAGPAEAIEALIPTWRADLEIEADLAEEVARIHGYEAIPPVTPDTSMPHYLESPLGLRNLVRETLAGAGLSEVVTAALVSPRRLETFAGAGPAGPALPGDDPPVGRPIRAVNALSSEHAVLRQVLIASLLEVLELNLNRGRDDVAIFEIGKGYGYDEATEAVNEWWRLGLVLVGASEPPAWDRPRRDWDVDDAKGIVELLADRLRIGPPTWTALTGSDVFHPGRSANGLIEGQLSGRVGELHPALAASLDLRADRIVIAEVALRGLAGGSPPAIRVTPIGRYPAVERDLSVVVAAERPAGEVERSMRAAGGPLLRAIRLFDIYRGAPLADAERSLSYRLTFQAGERTLTDAEIDAALGAISAALAGEIGGRIRT
jgi:phenylalanyl-tRNA synthetase beta chain